MPNSGRTCLSFLKKQLREPLLRANFAPYRSAFRRFIADVEQYVVIDSPKADPGNLCEFDLVLLVASQEFNRRVFGYPIDGLAAHQVERSLRELMGEPRYSRWVVRGSDDLASVCRRVVSAVESLAIPFLDQLDSTNQVDANCLRPGWQTKWPPLAEWEVKVYRGEASRKERPLRDATIDLEQMEKVQLALDRELLPPSDRARRKATVRALEASIKAQAVAAMEPLLKQAGFSVMFDNFHRTIRDVEQFIGFVTQPDSQGGEIGLDIRMTVMAPGASRTYRGRPAPIIDRFLSKMTDRKRNWPTGIESDLNDTVQQVLVAFEAVGLPFLNAIDSMAKLYEATAPQKTEGLQSN